MVIATAWPILTLTFKLAQKAVKNVLAACCTKQQQSQSFQFISVISTLSFINSNTGLLYS